MSVAGNEMAKLPDHRSTPLVDVARARLKSDILIIANKR